MRNSDTVKEGMFSSSQGMSGEKGPGSPRSARAHLEEALGKLGIIDEEATPLVIDDRDEDKSRSGWLQARSSTATYSIFRPLQALFGQLGGIPRDCSFVPWGRICLWQNLSLRRSVIASR